MFEFHTQKFETAEEREAVATLPAARRQWMVENLLFEYPLFKSVSDGISSFHRPVEGGTHGSGDIGGVLGDPRSGKSYICKNYVRRFPGRLGESGEEFPVVYLEARQDWTPSHAAEQLFMKTGAKSVPSLKVPALISKAHARLVMVRAELVIIDDAHFMLLEPKGRTLANFKSFVKGIADLNTCNLLLAGLLRLETFVESDGQLDGRGGFPKWLTKPLDWSLKEDQDQFRLLLHGIDCRLPFRTLSNLSSPDNAVDFYHLSGGMIGRVMNVVKDAARRAINADSACILPEHLQAAADLRMKTGDTYRPFRGLPKGAAA